MSGIENSAGSLDQLGAERPEQTGRSQSRWYRRSLGDIVAAGLLLLAVAIVVDVYGRARVDSGNGYYAAFWMGMGLAYITVLWQIWNQRWSAGWLMLLGIITFVPKFVMSPTRPIYFDETAHFQLLRHVVEHGTLFQYTPLLPIGTDYPGLQAVAATIHLVTGASDWQSALITVGGSHVCVPLLFYLCGREVLKTDRAAGIAALVYMANPQFLYGDTQFAYESLALVFMGACVLFYLRSLKSDAKSGAIAYGVLSALTGVACVATHHLTTMALGAILVVIALLWPGDGWILGRLGGRRARPGDVAADRLDASARRTLDGSGGASANVGGDVGTPEGAWPLLSSPSLATRLLPPAVVIGGFSLWIAFIAPSTISYLAPHVTQPIRGLLAVLRGSHYTHLGNSTTKVAATRVAFAGSQIPRYEIWAGYAAPAVFVGVGLVAAVLWIRNSWVRWRYTWLYVLALAYFLSLPAILLVGGAAGAHRSWATSFFPLGLLVGIVVVDGYHLAHGRIGKIVVAILLLVVLVGDTAAGSAADYRFPGPYEFGSDTRSVTAQTISMATWVKDNLGEDAHIATDRYTGLALVNVADAVTPQTSGKLPISEFWYDDYPPDPTLLRRMQRAGDDYIAVDLRSALYAPVEAKLFYAGEPTIVPGQNLSRLNTWPWLSLVYRSTDYEIFKIDFATYYAWYPSHAGDH